MSSKCFNLSPASFRNPNYLPVSAWVKHAPFAFWLIETIQPRRFVELGTHHGLSFFAFCQAIQQFNLDTSAFAVDTWAGDEHAGHYGDDVFATVRAENEKYSGFSTLVRSTFQDALSYFEDGSIDLLHIDGQHHYEDVKRDYESWLPKLTDNAVVLLHDTNVRERQFGVWRFFKGLGGRHPSFEFRHGHGLGILCPGSEVPRGLRNLTESDRETVEATRLAYASLGASVEHRQKSKLLREGLMALLRPEADLSQPALAALAIQSGDDIAVVRLGSAISAGRRTAGQQAAELQAEREARLQAERALRSADASLADARDRESAAGRKSDEADAKLAQAWNDAARARAEVVVGMTDVELLRACLRGRTTAVQRMRSREGSGWTQDAQPLRVLIEAMRRELHHARRELRRSRRTFSQERELLKLWGQAGHTRARLLAETLSQARTGRALVEARLNAIESSRWWRAYSHLRSGLTLPPMPTEEAPTGGTSDADTVAVENTGLFDREYYLKNNPDIASLGLDPLQHFARTGWREGRRPNPYFDTDAYVGRRSDIAERGFNPLVHYSSYGIFEGETAAPLEELDTDAEHDRTSDDEIKRVRASGLFDEDFYRRSNPDLAEMSIDLARHFVEAGWREGRKPSAFFDPRYYLEHNPDVASSGINPLLHFADLGAVEGRRPLPPNPVGETSVRSTLSEEDLDLALRVEETGLFDPDFYARYPDIAASAVDPALHFARDGWREGRRPSMLFDLASYTKLNPDVAGSGQNPLLHYADFGAIEGRAVFDPADYIESEKMPAAVRELVEMHRKTRLTAESVSDLTKFLKSDRRIHFPAIEQPDISILIIVWNQAHWTFRCLTALSEQRGPSLEIIIVDNASTDQTQEMLSRVEGVRVVRNQENEGFLLACNRGATIANGRTLLLLNSDAFVRDGALTAALGTLDSSSDIGAVGGRLILPSGRLQEAGSIIWSDSSTLGYGRNFAAEAGEAMFRRDVDYCSGAFLLTPLAVWNRLRGFDVTYAPAYYEEADYCMRLREHGLRVVYEPSATIDHFEFGSEAKKGDTLKMVRGNQKKFRQRHALALSSLHLPPSDGNLVRARTRSTRGQRRLLIIDNEVPYRWLGSGYPRAREIVQEAAAAGWFVTFYPLHQSQVDWTTARSEVSSEIEIASGWGATGLAEFLEARRSLYQTIIVSRPDNMALIKEIVSERPYLFSDTRLVYDAEALFSVRDILLAEWKGSALSKEEAEKSISAEIALSRNADAIVCVSSQEAEMFKDRSRAEVFVLNHPTICKLNAPGFEERKGFLFVGRLLERETPNWRGLTWFVDRCWPRIRALLPDAMLRVAGPLNADHSGLTGPGIELLGRVDDLEPIYAVSRVFLAPVHFAAGIPIKVLEATAAGLPTVATTLMAKQLSWTPGSDISAGDDVISFANRAVELHENREVWDSLVAASQRRIVNEYGVTRFRETLSRILSPSAPPNPIV